MYLRLAQAILGLHAAIIAFNVFGLVAVPIGAARGWAFVRVFWWRALHMALLATVALQALLGKLCLLTWLEDELLRRAGQASAGTPLIQRWVEQVIFWPLPLGFFAIAYTVIFAYALALWWLVPPGRLER